jgi:hypothetical protein
MCSLLKVNRRFEEHVASTLWVEEKAKQEIKMKQAASWSCHQIDL